MKFQVRRVDFLQLISKAQNIVSAKPTTPILASILLEASNDQLIMSATDLTISIRSFVDAKVTEEGAITLPARCLFQLVRELTSAEVAVSTLSSEILIVHAGNSHFRIQGMHKSEFPLFPDLSAGAELLLESSHLKETLSRTAFAAAREDSRQVLNGILMQKVEGLATFVGTDGKRLARNQLSFETDTSSSGSYIVPLKAVEELIKILDKHERVKLTLMPTKLAVEVGSTILVTNLLGGQYPDVSRIIPDKAAAPLSLHRDELISLLRQVAIFTEEDSHSVRFSFSDGSLQLSAASGNVGEGKVSMPVNYQGSKLEIAFNPHYFLDILRHTKDETVQLNVTDPYNPGLITDSSKAEFVIMPMHLGV